MSKKRDDAAGLDAIQHRWVQSSSLPRVLLLCLVALLLVVYLTTLSPTVSGGDNGEYITVAYELGVAHPPGYPLFTWIGHLLTYVPFGSIAWRVNLASALLATATGALIFVTLQRWLQDPWAALSGAGLFCFSPSVWRYAVVAEVFSLNNLCLTALVYWALRYWQSPDRRWIYRLALTAGLGLANHHSLIFAILPLGVCILIRDWRPALQPRTLLIAAFLFLAGLTPYLYLPWASAKRSLVSWGDLTTPGGFIDHLLRREYGTFHLTSAETLPRFGVNLRLYLADSAAQLLWIGFLLAVCGIVYVLYTLVRAKRPPGFGLALAATFLFYTLVWHRLANIDATGEANREILSRFWQMPNLLLCLLAAQGLAVVTRSVGRHRWVIAAASVLLVATQVAAHYRAEDASQDHAVYDFGKATLDSLPQRSLFLTRGDALVNVVRYLQRCESFRTDVVAIPIDLLSAPWMARAIRNAHPEVHLPAEAERSGISDLGQLVDSNRAFPTFISIPFIAQEEATLERGHEIWHVGFAYRLVPIGEPFGFEDYVRAAEAYSRYEPPGADDVRGRLWATFIRRQYWAREQNRAERLSLQPATTQRGFQMVVLSAQLLDRLVREFPDAPAKNYRTLGFAYAKLARIDPRYQPRMVDALKAYLSRNPSDPNARDIEKLVRSAAR